jgi:hypothetical protein
MRADYTRNSLKNIINIGKLGMSFRNNLLSLVFLPSLLLVGCGGGGEFNLGGGGGNLAGGGSSEQGGGTGGDTSGGDTGASTSKVSYLPLSVYIKNSDYINGFDSGDVFWIEGSYPYINGYLINPIDSTTLLPVDTATVDDYKMTVDDIEIDPKESFPMLQKVLGNTVYLRTALIFDLSGSVNEVDLLALKDEAKSYLAKALSPSQSNDIIKNQSFVIWTFGQDNPTIDDVVDQTGGFTSNLTTLENVVDGLSLSPSAPSNLHKAVVKAIGGYVDDTVVPVIDYSADGNNDLVDYFTSDGILLSQIVIFSSGRDTKADFKQKQMIDAIQSQGLLKYETVSTSSEQSFTNKIVFYYVLGGVESGVTYTALSDVSEKTTSLTLSGGSYNFSDTLIQDQIAAIDARIDLDNQYIYRYAFLPRQGEHISKFESNSDGFNYAVTSKYTSEDFPDFSAVPPDSPIGTPSYELASLVEITGANGEYLSGAKASLSEVTVFKPVTRWTTEEYGASAYTWGLAGGTGVKNADGSFTISSISVDPATLTLTNTDRAESVQILITN